MEFEGVRMMRLSSLKCLVHLILKQAIESISKQRNMIPNIHNATLWLKCISFLLYSLNTFVFVVCLNLENVLN